MSTTAVAAPDLSAFTDYTPEQVQLVKNTVCVGSTDDELKLFLMVCKQTQLNPFIRQIHAVKRWSKAARGEVMQIQTGIDGLRLTAERTGKYMGQTEPMWCGEDGLWKDIWLDDAKRPVAAKVGIYKAGFDRPFWGIAKFNEYAQTYEKDGRRMLAGLWGTMPSNQIAKCAEALGLRKAFPMETSKLYIPEELENDAGNPAEERPEGKYTVEARAELAEPAKVVDISKPNGAPPAESASPAPAAEPPKRGKKADPAPPGAAAPQATAEKPAEKPAETGKVVFEVHVHTPEGVKRVITEPDYAARQNAELRAQALANSTGLTHEVVENAGGERVSKGKYNPPKHQPAVNRVNDEPPQQTAAVTAPEPASAAEPPSTGKVAAEWQKRARAVVARVAADPAAKGMPEKTIEGRCATFLVAYLGVKGPRELPKEDAAYVDALPDLESVAAQDVNVLLSEPAECGRRKSTDNKNFTELFDNLKWPPAVRETAREWARLRKNSPEDLAKHIETIGADFDPLPDVLAYFRLAVKTAKAGKFYREVKSRNQSMYMVLDQMQARGWGKTVEQVTTAEAEQQIDAFVAANKEASRVAKKKAETPAAAPPPPPPAEEESGGLFGDDD